MGSTVKRSWPHPLQDSIDENCADDGQLKQPMSGLKVPVEGSTKEVCDPITFPNILVQDRLVPSPR